MICVSIQNKDLETIFDLLEERYVEMAEIRLDRCPQLGQEEIEELFSNSDVPLIATCRISDAMPAAEAEAKLITAIKAGAAYVDLELEAPAMMSKRIRREARECGTVLIRSYHDFEGTDSRTALEALVEKCQHLGAEIAKIVTTARMPEDARKVLSLYDRFAPETLVAFCMGEEGRQSRLDCLKKGAPFSYAAFDEAAAPGQWPAEEMFEAVYGNLQAVESEPLRMPASKSFAQRAIIAAALADGVSHLRGYSPCGDNEAALAVARALGAEVTLDEDVLTIRGTAGAPYAGDSLHVGESGFLTRLMIPLMARLARGPVTLSGEKTLLRRPLTGARDMMAAFRVALSGEQIPLTVNGRLTPGEAEISGQYGSQLVSGLLAALPLCREDSVIHLESPKSIPYIFITLDVLKQFGIRIENEMEGDEEFVQTQDWGLCEAMTFRIKGGQRYKAADLDLEADWSAAANFLVAGAIFGQVALEGLDTKSLQADLSILDILVEAGASLSQEEETGVVHVRKAPLRAFEVDASNCPDLFPVIAVLAAFCQGTSRIGGVGRLANKESDRASAIVDMLTRMGVKAAVKGDRLLVEGHSLAQRSLTGNLLRGGEYTSHHDHRMVMALKVAAFGADGPVRIDDEQCVAKSFPDFGQIYARL
ncbi:MAG: 3-phosphoshikimate 1-carboxyvinyltransferase [Bacteroidales bacterium]|nr:3-phosphoshikimate 1-carboxyvinyltransferase [Bacteroidales bacterium]